MWVSKYGKGQLSPVQLLASPKDSECFYTKVENNFKLERNLQVYASNAKKKLSTLNIQGFDAKGNPIYLLKVTNLGDK